MSSPKRYWWLKLKEGFFEQKEIKKLRKIAGGDTYTIIYLKMQLKSLIANGTLFFENFEDDFAEELALDLDEKVDNVRVTLLYLEKHDLIEKVSVNEFLLPAVKESTGNETAVASRVRKHREKSKMLLSNTPVTIGNVELELEKDIDIYIEKEKDIETDIEAEIKKENKIISEEYMKYLGELSMNDLVYNIENQKVELKQKQDNSEIHLCFKKNIIYIDNREFANIESFLNNDYSDIKIKNEVYLLYKKFQEDKNAKELRLTIEEIKQIKEHQRKENQEV